MIYGDATGFASYFEARGKELPGTWDDEAIEAALLVASEWIDGIYGSLFIGYKTDGFEQEREWPRTSATVCSAEPRYTYETDAIPARVTKATYEAAFRQLTTPGSLQVDYIPGKYKSVTVDVISVDYIQFPSANDAQIQIGAVDTLLWPLLDTTRGQSSGLSGGVGRA